MFNSWINKNINVYLNKKCYESNISYNMGNYTTWIK